MYDKYLLKTPPGYETMLKEKDNKILHQIVALFSNSTLIKVGTSVVASYPYCALSDSVVYYYVLKCISFIYLFFFLKIWF
jgi:hypothetical protein